MRINNNLQAINTHRQLGVNAVDNSKSMEKLSSGLRINRAGDDAAGLAISEKMRGQIRGLYMASKNSSDTISLIQTAEGALNETHAIIQRMRELTVQAANDTNTADDRAQLQSEISQLIKEVDRIGNTTEFNTKKLLDGSVRGVSDAVPATAKLNANSAVGVNTDLLNAFQAAVKNDSNFFMDGAHMLVRINGSPNSAPDIANDFKFIGPDGAEYKFVAGTEVPVSVRALQDNTIITSTQEVAQLAFSDFKDIELLSAINGALTAFDQSLLPFRTAGVTAETAPPSTNEADGHAAVMLAVKEAANMIKERYGKDPTINEAIDKIVDDSAADIKKLFVYNLATAGTIGPPDVNGAPGYWDVDVTGLSLTGTDADGTVETALNSLGNNITVAKGSVIVDDSTLAKGTILAVGSSFTVSNAVPSSALNIDVDKAEVTISMDSNGTVWVGGTSLAANSSITLKDGTSLTHVGNGKIEVAQGFVQLAARATVAANAPGINTVAANSVISKGSNLEAASTFETGSVVGAAKNAEIIRGSVEIGLGASSITFGGNHTLKAEFNNMEVGLSNTLVFSSYRAGSNDLENSVMSQVGANSGQIMFISMNDMRAEALGIDKINVETRYGAATAVETVNNALQKVSQQRSVLGAVQNRLEHTIKNLDAAGENLQAAESRIRDVDMAKEVVMLTRTNILQQASQAMLAQANQAPQSVLQLLR